MARTLPENVAVTTPQKNSPSIIDHPDVHNLLAKYANRVINLDDSKYGLNQDALNNYSAIQAALNDVDVDNINIVLIPPAKGSDQAAGYKFSQELKVKSNTWLMGLGSRSNLIANWASAAGGGAYFIGQSGSAGDLKSNIRFRGFKLTGQYDTAAGTPFGDSVVLGMQFFDTSDLYLDDMDFANIPGWFFGLHGGNRGHAFDIRFANCGRGGIDLRTSNSYPADATKGPVTDWNIDQVHGYNVNDAFIFVASDVSNTIIPERIRISHVSCRNPHANAAGGAIGFANCKDVELSHFLNDKTYYSGVVIQGCENLKIHDGTLRSFGGGADALSRSGINIDASVSALANALAGRTIKQLQIHDVYIDDATNHRYLEFPNGGSELVQGYDVHHITAEDTYYHASASGNAGLTKVVGADYQITAQDMMYGDFTLGLFCNSNPTTVTLPPHQVAQGKRITIIRYDSNANGGVVRTFTHAAPDYMVSHAGVATSLALLNAYGQIVLKPLGSSAIGVNWHIEDWDT